MLWIQPQMNIEWACSCLKYDRLVSSSNFYFSIGFFVYKIWLAQSVYDYFATMWQHWIRLCCFYYYSANDKEIDNNSTIIYVRDEAFKLILIVSISFKFIETHSLMEQHVLKNFNNCLNTNIYSYLETSGCQSCNLYLNVVNCFNTSLN
jgi:hypothetical protein